MTSVRTRRLKIAVVAPSLRILGGQAVQADGLLEGWRHDPDVEAWLVPINPALAGPLVAVQHVRYLRTIATQLAYWPLLVRELRKADVVHVFSAAYFSFVLSPWPAVRIARALSKPVVFNYHSGEAPDHLRRSAFARRTLRRADINVVPSRFLQGVFARYGIDARVIPNLVDLTRFPFKARESVRPHLISTRNFEPLYNVACTLRAFQIVQARCADATLTLVGSGSQDAALRSLARELRLRNVRFLGRVPPADMPRAYAEADVYVQTPLIDNMPISVLEAFGSGLPVVSTNVGGVPAILTPGVHGLLAPPDDHAAVAAAVLRLVEQPTLARSLAQQAHSACAAFTWQATRPLWLDTYRSAARLPGAAGAPVHAS